MGAGFPKEVTTGHYHLWTDALHARALARQTRNQWDRGTYVRWTITTAWTCFELACEDALCANGLGNRFKQKVDEAVQALSLPAFDWGKGIWQRVLSIYELRKDYIHPGIPQARLFAPLEEADRAILTLREGIRAIYMHARKPAPDWIQDDEDRGWDGERRAIVHGTVTHAGANPNDPEVIRIAYVFEGKEYTREILPPGSDYRPCIDSVLGINLPISEVRVYQGNDIIWQRPIRRRGS